MNIVPAWKNAAYRQSLTAGAQTLLPTKFIGEVELTDADLEGVHGGSGILTDNLNDNHINVLNGRNSLLNNIGILGSGNSSCSNEPSGGSSLGSHSHGHQC